MLCSPALWMTALRNSSAVLMVSNPIRAPACEAMPGRSLSSSTLASSHKTICHPAITPSTTTATTAMIFDFAHGHKPLRLPIDANWATTSTATGAYKSTSSLEPFPDVKDLQLPRRVVLLRCSFSRLSPRSVAESIFHRLRNRLGHQENASKHFSTTVDKSRSYQSNNSCLTVRCFLYIVCLMSGRDYRGEFEHIVVLALLRLSGRAYGVTVRQEIEVRIGREVSIGAIYATLDRLEAKGYVKSQLGDPTPERGGRSKRFFHVTAKGIAAVNRSQRAIKT